MVTKQQRVGIHSPWKRASLGEQSGNLTEPDPKVDVSSHQPKRDLQTELPGQQFETGSVLSEL